MIDLIKHFALTAHGSVHDEEALTSLELAARTTAKVNEIIDDVNQQREELEKGIPAHILAAINELYENGQLEKLINDTLFNDVHQGVDALDSRLNNIVANGTSTEGNTELIDARQAKNGDVYTTLGEHVRAIADGSALMDALKPGTIRHGRISAGMLMGELASRYVIGEQWTTAGKWTGAGYVDTDTLEIVEHSSYKFTEPCPCAYGDTFRVYTGIYGNLIPVAIYYDEDLNIIGTSGAGVGTNSWEMVYHYIQVTRNAAYVAFQCGASQVTDFRVLRYSARRYQDPVEAMGGRGYIRAYAFKRSDTVTDRAQVKMWFPITELEKYRFRVEPLIMKNVTGWTARYFAATTDSSYELSLGETDSGRSYGPNLALCTDLTIPENGSGETPFKYLCVFVDLIPTDPEKRVDAIFAPPTLDRFSGSTIIKTYAEPENVTLHGAVDSDYIGVVPPGGMASPVWRKRIMILGDSLARGNTLPKSATWFNLACSSRDMEYFNGANNGEPVTEMSADLSGLDYFVLQGGANDKRLNLPIDGFKANIERLVLKAREESPKCKILLMTNWRRTESANDLGLHDSDYVAAMLETAEELGVPCVNNYAYSLNLLDPNIAAWADDGIVNSGSANIHFSIEANRWLAPRFLADLERL